MGKKDFKQPAVYLANQARPKSIPNNGAGVQDKNRTASTIIDADHHFDSPGRPAAGDCQDSILDLPKGDETILLVEDDPLVRNLVREILTRQGYKIIIAVDGNEAQGVCRKYAEEIDLLLTDIIMPVQCGEQVYRNLIEIRPALKVLFMSGYAHHDCVNQDLVNEGQAFIKKPFTVQALAEKVRQVLDDAEP